MVSKLVPLLLLIVLCKCLIASNLKLKQVLIFSRHNIRYPIVDVGELGRYSPRRWPKLTGHRGHLTPKGARLEGYMGEYFAEWFKTEEFLPEGCPDEETVFAYANAVSRTKATARAFLDSAFKNCNVTVHYQKSEKRDPIFGCIIHNTNEGSKYKTIEEIDRKLQDNSKLKAACSEMNKILEIEGSEGCKKDGICDLNKGSNNITYEVGRSIWVDGPVAIGHVVMDSFLMSYYDGKPIQDVAWGQITTPEKWKILMELIRQDQNITYTAVAKDCASPLVKYLTETFKNYDNKPKLMLLVGHDTNMILLAVALGFQPIIDLPNQYEEFPIGGKYVFQKWTDGKVEYLKVEYVYPSWSQLREGSKYSLENPLQRVVMRLNWCNTDGQGFCLWKEFVDKL